MAGRARSLRLRLTVSYVLVFLGLQVVLLGSIVLLRREQVQKAVDLDLESRARDFIDQAITAHIGWTSEEIEREMPAGLDFLFLVVRDENGVVLGSWNPRAKGDVMPPWTEREFVSVGPLGSNAVNISQELAEELAGIRRRLRMVNIPFRIGPDFYYLQAAVEDPVLTRYLGPFLDLAVVGVPVGVLASMLAAWYITGRALRPLDRLAAAARAVSPGRLGERFQPASDDAEFLRLAGELNSALARIEAAYKAQDQFLSNVSHELKTPLAVLLVQAQVARMGHHKEAEARAFLDHAEHELKRLSRVVESFLVLARARAAAERSLEPVPLADLVLQAVQDGRVQADQAGVRLIANLSEVEDGAPDPAVVGDADLLQTMVDNLVRNAIAHSPNGEAVAIEGGADEHSLWIAVRDRGPGIPDEHKDRIFERFVQLNSKEGPNRGSGLGLAIARDVARVHGGSVRFEDRPGGGSSVVLTLPRA